MHSNLFSWQYCIIVFYNNQMDTDSALYEGKVHYDVFKL